MTSSAKKLVLAAALGGAALLSGCATDPYYDNNYGYGYDRGYAYGYDYANPYYVAPSVGFGYSYSDGYDRRYYRGDRGNWRGRDGYRDPDADGWRDRNGAWHENPRDRHGENSPG